MARMSNDLPRSPEMMNADDTALLVVDVQENLVRLLPDRARIEWNVRRLLAGAAILGLPRRATEQYPEKLGPTAASLAKWLSEPAVAKLTFSCGSCGSIFEQWQAEGRHRVLVCGIESHVCIQQTSLDLLAAGFRVYVPMDAVGTRHAVDHEAALRRLESSGVTLTSTESALFEWCRIAGTPEFKQIIELAKESPPAAASCG